jgi:hypothetical protein
MQRIAVLRKLHVPLALWAFFCVAVGATLPDENWPKHNGHWWLSQVPHDRISFLEGYVAAKTDSNASLQGLKRSGKVTSEDGLRVLDVEQEASDFYNLSLGQLSDGLTHFYSDYRNETVDFNGALSFVRHQIRGRTQEQLDRELILIRCEASSPADVWGCVRAGTPASLVH